jgi:hypothetical protein
MKWKPIQSGGSTQCDTCPEVVGLRRTVQALEVLVSEVKRPDVSAELYNEMGERWTEAVWDAKRWREIADALYNHLPWGTSAGAIEARRKYDEAVRGD